jgi:hypothetical protein
MVDACGRPTVVQKCGSCNVLTGGIGHSQLEYIGTFNIGVNGQYVDKGVRPPGPIQMDRDVDPALQDNTAFYQESRPQDNSEPGYCLRRDHVGDDSVASVAESMRDVSARACRAQRLLLHAAMLCGAVFGGPSWREAAQVFVHADCLNKDGEAAGGPDAAFRSTFGGLFSLDWTRMKRSMGGAGSDDVSLLMHESLTLLSVDEATASQPRNGGGVAGGGVGARAAASVAASLDSPASWATLPDRKAREAWEQAMAERVLDRLLVGAKAAKVDDVLESLKRRFFDDNEHHVGLMLQERPVTAYGPVERGLTAPGLFVHRQSCVRQ